MPVKKRTYRTADGKQKTKYYAIITTYHNGIQKKMPIDGVGYDKWSEANAVCERVKSPTQVIDEKRLTVFYAHKLYRENLEREIGVIVRPKTAKLFDYLFDSFLQLFRHRQIMSLSYEDMEQFKYHLVAKGFSNRTVNIGLTQVKKFFRFALRKRWISERPDIVMLPQSYRMKNVEWLNESEIEKLLKFSNKSQYLYISLMVYTGMRPFEAQMLKWSDIDFNRGEIIIWSDMNKDNKRGRVIPIHSRLQEVLKYAPTDKPTVCPWGRQDTASTQISRLSKATGIRVNPYILRKTFGSLMIKNGVSIEILSKLMGSDPKTLITHYIGILDSHKRDSIERISIGFNDSHRLQTALT